MITAAELIAGLGEPHFKLECGEPVGRDAQGQPVYCGWASGQYHELQAAQAAKTDHHVMRHGKRRPNGVDELHRGVVDEWREWCRVSDIGID